MRQGCCRRVVWTDLQIPSTVTLGAPLSVGDDDDVDAAQERNDFSFSFSVGRPFMACNSFPTWKRRRRTDVNHCRRCHSAYTEAAFTAVYCVL